MAKTIEELDFKLKVDNSEFDKEIDKANKKAHDLNIQLSEYLNLKKGTGNLTNKEYLTLKRLDNLESNRRINAEREATAQTKRLTAEERLAQVKDKVNKSQERHNRLLDEAKTLALSYASIWGAKKLLGELVGITGEFEMQRTTLNAMLQDAQGADAIYEQIKQLAVVSPFGFKELVTYTKQLAAYSVPIGDLYGTTKMLADVSAGLGVGMDRLVLAYGQVRSAAFLRGQEVRQFTEAGIPILDMLAKQFEELEGRVVSTGEVFDKISKRQVPFEMVAKVFRDMTSEGGKFYNMQEIQSETLKGKISNLKDAYEIMFSEIGNNLEPIMKGAVDAIRGLISNYEQIGRQILAMAISYGAARTAITLFTAETLSAGIANTALLKGLRNISAFVSKNPYALLAAGVAALAGGIYKLATAQTAEERAMASVSKAVADFNAANAEEEMNLEYLVKRLESAKKGTKEYETAKRQLYSEYGNYINEIDAENIALGKTAEAYKSIMLAVRDANREKAMETGLADIAGVYRDEYESVFKQLRGTLQSLGVDANGAIGKQLGAYVRGEISDSDLSKEALDVISRVRQSLEAKLKTPGGMFGNGLSFYGVDIDALRRNYKDAKDVAMEARKTLADELDMIYGPEPKTSGGGTAGGGQETDNTDVVKALQDRIALLERLRDVYESMRPYFSDSQIREFFSTNFGFTDPSLWENFDFGVQIDALLPKLDTLGAKGKEAADVIREKLAVALGKDLVDAQKAAESAASSLADYMSSWNIGDETEGTGSIYKVTKIVSDYQKSIESLNDKRDEATKKLNEWIEAEKKAGRTVSETTKAEKENEIAAKYNVTSTNLLNKATEDVRKTASDYVKEWASLNGLDLSNWSHKTIFELNRIQNALDNFDASSLPEEIVSSLEKAGVDIESFKGAVQDVVQSFYKRTEDLENERKWAGILKSVDALAGLFDKIGEFAEASGDSSLKAFANGISSSFRTMGDMAEKVAKQDYLGAIISGVTAIATAFLEAASNAAELERNIRKGKVAAESLRTELALGKDTESVFGEDDLKSFSNAWEVAAEKFNVVAEDIKKAKEKMSGGTDNDSNGWGAAGGAAAGAALGAAIGVWFFGVGAAVGAAVGSIVGLIVGGLTDIGLELDNFTMSLMDMADEIDAPLINEDTGAFNVDTLELILETYDNLDQASRDAIEAMIAHTKDYEAALEQLRDGMKEIFGSVADDISSKFIEAFKASGEAALDYADILDDVATSLAQMVLKSALMERVFTDELANDVANKIATGKMDEALAIFDAAMTEAQALAPAFQQFLEGTGEYMQPESAGGSLGSGIKGVTEDTANLLASYINAIRADVAYGRIQSESILAEVRNIASYVASPTLMDYLNKIQANTFDNARATESILSDIRSMMTSDGGFTALRVYQ